MINLTFARAFTAVLLTTGLAQTAMAQARGERRGEYQLTIGPERGSVNFGGAQGKVTANSVDFRLQAAPAARMGSMGLVGFLGVEMGYGKVSQPFFYGFSDGTRMFTRWEFGTGLTHHQKNTDLGAYAYALIWDDGDFTASASGQSSNFYMIKASARHHRVLAEIAAPFKQMINSAGSMLDGSLWLLSDTFSVGLRYQQRTTYQSGYSNPNTRVQFLSLAFGLIK